MNPWPNAAITEKGLALQAKLTQGNSLTITKAVTGTGYVDPTQMLKQTAVTGPTQALTFKPVSYPETNKCAMPVCLNNDEVETGYTARQVGVYATDPDEGEILYFIAECAGETKGTEIPSKTEMAGYSAEWTFYFQYGQADSVTVTVDPANTISEAKAKTLISAYVDENIKAISTDDIDSIMSA